MAGLGLLLWSAAEPAAAPPRITIPGAGRLAAAFALGASMAGFFIVPFAVELDRVEVARVARGEQRQSFVAHGLEPRELWQRRLWSRLELSEHAGTAAAMQGAEMPFYFGVVLLSLVPLARRAPPGLLALLAIVLALSLRPVAAAVSRVAPPLAVLQFPWRFLGLATFAAAALAGFAAARLLARWHGRRWVVLVPGALVALLVLDAVPYTGAAEWLPPYRGLVRIRWPAGQPWHPDGRLRYERVPRPYPDRVAGYFLPPPETGAAVSLFCCAYAEYFTPAVRRAFFQPRDPTALSRAGVGLAGWETGPVVRLQARPYASWRPVGGGREEPVAPVVRRKALREKDWSPARKLSRLEARPARRAGGETVVALDGRPGTVVVLEQDYPGWQVWTPAGWRDARPTRGGLLHTAVAAGQRQARFRFTRTRDRTAGALLSAAALVGAVALIVSPHRRRPTAAPAPRRG